MIEVIKGDTRSLDYSSCRLKILLGSGCGVGATTYPTVRR